jgi:putative transposase
MVMFIDWYNNHQHSGINFVTPNQRHLGLDIEILEKRKEVYFNHLQKNKDADIRITS